jgi:hypothetical protein
MKKKIFIILTGVVLFLGTFTITSAAFEEADCKKDCPAESNNGCPLIHCDYGGANGNLRCYYKTTGCNGELD